MDSDMIRWEKEAGIRKALKAIKEIRYASITLSDCLQYYKRVDGDNTYNDLIEQLEALIEVKFVEIELKEKELSDSLKRR